MREHVFPLRVYFEDTDSGGIVYYANYLKFAERARTEMMRGGGIESSRLMTDDGVALAVKECHADFKRPAKLDDVLGVHSRIVKIGGASIEAEQDVCRGGEVLVALKIKLACMDIHTGTPKRLPDAVRRYCVGDEGA